MIYHHSNRWPVSDQRTLNAVAARLIRLIFVMLTTLLLGANPSPSSLDKPGLTGVWEAILPYGDQLVHIEIGGNEPSFLVLVSAAESKYICVLQSSAIEGNKLTLHFAPPTASGDSITITGEGYGGAISGGLVTGTMEMGNPLQKNRKMSTWKIFLRAGTWTRKFNHFSEIAEQAAQQARVTAAIEAGSISNIPIYNQVIFRGEWTDRAPSWEEAKKALNRIQLFIEHPTSDNDTQKAAILQILANKLPYRVQFIGKHRDNRKTILCNFFVERQGPNGLDTFPDWKQEEVHRPLDKAPDFWRIEYDPERDECLNFSPS
jgi:hypothetical protein